MAQSVIKTKQAFLRTCFIFQPRARFKATIRVSPLPGIGGLPPNVRLFSLLIDGVSLGFAIRATATRQRTIVP